MTRRTSLADHAGRLALAWVFLRAGSDVLRDPSRAARTAGPLLGRLRRRAPVALPDDAVLVRANAATQVAAGALLAAGVAERPAAMVLAASLLPTTLAGHAYWTVEDRSQRPNQRNHFNKNLAIMGALVLAARRRPGPG